MDSVNLGQPVGPTGPLMVAPQIWKHQRGPHVLHHHHADGWVSGARRGLLDAGRRSSHDLSFPVGVLCTQYYIDLLVLCDSLFGSQKVQLLVAKVLSGFYACIMMVIMFALIIEAFA